MPEFVSRVQWRPVSVDDKEVLLPAMVNKVSQTERGTKFDYWKIFTRVEGRNYYHNFRIRNLETPPLIEALQSLIFLIDTVGLPNRLHTKRRKGLDSHLPVGVTGPHTKAGRTFFRVSFPESDFRSVGHKIFVEGTITKAKAKRSAINLRKQAVKAYQEANEKDAILVVARLWELIENLEGT